MCTERKSLTKECGWKDGDRGGLAQWQQTHGKKKVKVCLDINRPSHGRSEPLFPHLYSRPVWARAQAHSSRLAPHTLEACANPSYSSLCWDSLLQGARRNPRLTTPASINRGCGPPTLPRSRR